MVEIVNSVKDINDERLSLLIEMIEKHGVVYAIQSDVETIHKALKVVEYLKHCEHYHFST